MIETIEQIRTLLTQLESEANQADKAIEFRSLSGLELPDIVSDMVDLLMPELKPFEVSFYIYFLRHSIIANGTPYVRVSRREMQAGVMKSTYASSSGETSYAAVKDTMNGLEAVGAIRQESDPNKEGTLYRVLLPEEIEVCQRRREKLSERHIIAATEAEADFYNIRENRLKIYERDNYHCTYCSKQLTRFTATLDHVTPVSEGGDNSAENLKTACLQCNSRKTARPLGDFLAEKDPTLRKPS